MKNRNKTIRSAGVMLWMALVALWAFTACEKDPLLSIYRVEEDGTWTLSDTNANLIKDAVTDNQGYTYDAVRLGNQVWLKQNLLSYFYDNGAQVYLPVAISHALPSQPSTTQFGGDTYDDAFGLLYKWDDAMNINYQPDEASAHVQGACPAGWHLPTSAEWHELIDFVGQQPEYQCSAGENAIAKALCSTEIWPSSNVFGAPGCAPECNNATGFSALPVGDLIGFQNSHFGEFASFWTADEYDSENAYCFTINYNEATVSRSTRSKDVYLAVRCVQD